MSEYTAPSELEASEAAIKLANEYREAQRQEAEENRQNPESESEEEFLERVRTISETSPGGFSAPYVRPAEVEVQETVEDQLEDDRKPLDEVVNTGAGEVGFEDLTEPNVEARAAFGQQDDASIQARAGLEDQQDAIVEDETPRPDPEASQSSDATEVKSNDQTTIVDTGYTDPNQIETAQSIVNAEQDAEAEKNDEPAPSLDAQPIDHTDDDVKELSFADKIAAIKTAKTSKEVDTLVGDDTRKPVLNAAQKRKDELS